jgi:hypothetical protein
MEATKPIIVLYSVILTTLAVIWIEVVNILCKLEEMEE